MLGFPKWLIILHWALTDPLILFCFVLLFSLSVVFIAVWLNTNIWLWREETCFMCKRKRSKDNICFCVNSLLSLPWLLFQSQTTKFPWRRHSLEINSTPHYYYLHFVLPICTSVYFAFTVCGLFKMTPIKYSAAFSKLWYLWMHKVINKIGG